MADEAEVIERDGCARGTVRLVVRYLPDAFANSKSRSLR